MLQLLPSIIRCNCYLTDLVVTSSATTTSNQPTLRSGSNTRAAAKNFPHPPARKVCGYGFSAWLSFSAAEVLVSGTRAPALAAVAPSTKERGPGDLPEDEGQATCKARVGESECAEGAPGA